jgi:hypothetical protein
MSKFWLDDERPAPDQTWQVFTTSEQMIAELRRLQHPDNAWVLEPKYDYLHEFSLDHDLGGDDTGMKVLKYMAAVGIWPRVLTIHTANPPAREQMLRAANADAPEWVDIYIKTW